MYENDIVLIGFVGADPSIYVTTSGTPLAKFPLATKETLGKNPDGTYNTRTDWHDIIAYDGLAEYIDKSVRKGYYVMVRGGLHYSVWKEGEKKRKRAEIKISRLIKLERDSNDATPPPEQEDPGTMEQGETSE